jgi:hypothetical protein
MNLLQRKIVCSILLLIPLQLINGQFLDHFDSTEIHAAWMWFSGDGDAEIDFKKGPEHAIIYLDATKDKMNIWWAVIRRHIKTLDQKKLVKAGYELRVESKIKVSDAPRRVNMSFNNQRTTDFHSFLKEFDITDTSNWHVISMTTKNFDVKPDDKIHVQLALMDWGRSKYQLEVDYVKVDVVNSEKTNHDLGNPQTYHPPVPPVESFAHKLPVQQDVTIDKKYSDKNFHNWTDPLQPQPEKLLPVSHEQIILLKFNTENYKHAIPKGNSVLALHLHEMERSPDFKKDFGMVRLVEIMGGDENWNQKEVTYESFLQGQSPDEVFNQQTIIDVDLRNHENKTIYFTLSEAVMNRILSGRTKGLAVFSLGAVHASFYGSEANSKKVHPVIYFNDK